MTLTQRQRRILKLVGYPILAVIVFVFSLHWSFPYERLEDKVVELAAPKFSVEIASVSSTFLPGGVVLDTVLLESKPKPGEENPTRILIDRARVDVGLLALLGGRASVDVVAEIGAGEVEVEVDASAGELALKIHTESLPLDTIPNLGEALGMPGLPVKGGLDADVDITLPEQRLDLAEGSIRLGCPECIVGDGETKVKLQSRGRSRRSQAASIFGSGGLTVPPLNLGAFEAEIVVSGGKGTVTRFSGESADGDLSMYGSFQLAEKFGDSRFEKGCFKFRLSDVLKQREPEFGNVPSLMGVPPDESGYSNVMLLGKLAGARWIVAKNCQPDGSAERVNLRGSSRPRTASRPPRPTPVRNAGADDDADADADADADPGAEDDGRDEIRAALSGREGTPQPDVGREPVTVGEGRPGPGEDGDEARGERDDRAGDEDRAREDEREDERDEIRRDDVVDDDEGYDGEEGEEDEEGEGDFEGRGEGERGEREVE
ncbi:type II secretion system protein GspN [Haliangium sp.]|uniref:type II secretion system protein GspN n=1 Tax=Haliangium sp. TaxID=2663208 RepID=UPI003D0D66D7